MTYPPKHWDEIVPNIGDLDEKPAKTKQTPVFAGNESRQFFSEKLREYTRRDSNPRPPV